MTIFADIVESIEHIEKEYNVLLSGLRENSTELQRDIAQMHQIQQVMYDLSAHLQPILYNINDRREKDTAEVVE